MTIDRIEFEQICSSMPLSKVADRCAYHRFLKFPEKYSDLVPFLLRRVKDDVLFETGVLHSCISEKGNLIPEWISDHVGTIQLAHGQSLNKGDEIISLQCNAAAWRYTGEVHDEPKVGSDRIIHEKEFLRLSEDQIKMFRNEFVNWLDANTYARADAMIELIVENDLGNGGNISSLKRTFVDGENCISVTCSDVSTTGLHEKLVNIPVGALKNLFEWSFVFLECFTSEGFVGQNIKGFRSYKERVLAMSLLRMFDFTAYHSFELALRGYLERAMELGGYFYRYVGKQWNVGEKQVLTDIAKKNLFDKKGGIRFTGWFE